MPAQLTNIVVVVSLEWPWLWHLAKKSKNTRLNEIVFLKRVVRCHTNCICTSSSHNLLIHGKVAHWPRKHKPWALSAPALGTWTLFNAIVAKIPVDMAHKQFESYSAAVWCSIWFAWYGWNFFKIARFGEYFMSQKLFNPSATAGFCTELRSLLQNGLV